MKKATIQKWNLIPTVGITDEKVKRTAFRLNALGSFYYFVKVVLRRHKLYDPLHADLAGLIEQEFLKLVIEWPRGHHKTTIFAEGASMWWALPFNNEDETLMRTLGYGDSFIRWMKIAHDRDTRTLIVSENKDNVADIGSRIDLHYRNNELFRWLFPEIIPDTSCTWGAHSMVHKRTKASPNGEGTYDLLSVGMALQSRHYDRVIEDDLVGKDARNSDVVMRDTIDYHKLLPGAFEATERYKYTTNDEIVVGNRWSLKDLNSWIRENEPWNPDTGSGFKVISHSALGGCCSKHPVGDILLPTLYSKQKLDEILAREGLYDFSCQYLNNPVSPGVALFDESWLQYYSLEKLTLTDNRAVIHHHVKDGTTIKDLLPSELPIFMIVDPNHAGNQGRCRHAITVTGVQKAEKTREGNLIPMRIYLLDVWAESCNYERFVAKIYEMADYWKLSKFWLEVVAAQKYLKFYLDYRNKVEKRQLKVEPLKIDTSANAKAKRIEALNPYFAEGSFWVRQKFSDFLIEYKSYPNGITIDILDTLGYGPQIWSGRCVSQKQYHEFWSTQRQQSGLEKLNIGGY